MRKSIHSNIEIFKSSYNKICELVDNHVKVDEIPHRLEAEYLPNEIKELIEDIKRIRTFKKIDKVHIIYRCLSIIVLLLFIANFLLLVSLASLAIKNPTSTTDLSFFSMPILFSLAGIILSIILVINSFWENQFLTGLILISFFFFSQVFTDTFIIFNSSSIFYWLPIMIFIITFFLTVRLALPKRERALRLLKKLDKIGVEISSIPEELFANTSNLNQTGFFESFSRPPNSKAFFKNLPYLVKKNPTSADLINWTQKKKGNNVIFLVLTGVIILLIITLLIIIPLSDFSVYEMIEFISIIAFFLYLFFKRKSLNKIDDSYISNALREIKGIN